MIGQLRKVIKNREEEAVLKACRQGADMMTAWRGMNIPADRFYLHAHMWLLPLSTRRFRLGLDEIAQLLLQPITGIQVSSDKGTGEITWDFSCMGRMVQIPCPVEGRLAEVNSDLLIDPPRIHEDPYGKGWLIDLELQGEADFSQLFRGEKARVWMATEMERIRRSHTTIMDGGELLYNPAKWISEQEWRNLLDVFIIQPAKKKFL